MTSSERERRLASARSGCGCGRRRALDSMVGLRCASAISAGAGAIATSAATSSAGAEISALAATRRVSSARAACENCERAPRRLAEAEGPAAED